MNLLMRLFCQQEPIQFPLFAPLPQLRKILSHKEQLFAGVHHKICIRQTQVCKLGILIARHLINHRTLQMNNFIMREHQYILLTLIITHRKGHFIMIILAEIRIKLHIIKEIMHPAHIPLHGKVQTTIFCFSSHHRPCGRLLCHHNCSLVASGDQRIDMTEELYCLQILILAVFVRQPLSILFSIIKIKHGCNRIHTQTIHVIILHPHECTSDQEILYFVFTVIKNFGSPVRMLSHSRVRIFIQTGSIKVCQSVCISGEMRRYPV